MFLIKSLKNCSIFGFLFFSAACSFWQTEQNTNSNLPPISGQIETGLPFESKEPEAFQTGIVVTNYLHGEKMRKRYFLARNGNRSLMIFNQGETAEHSVLKDGEKTIFIKNKTFRQAEPEGVADSGEMLEFLTTRWLNRKTAAGFEKLAGTENDLTRYRVRLGNSALSEVILTYDENLKMPVKQEFYSISGEQKTLTMTVELENFQTSADEKLFVLPQDYKEAGIK